MVRKYRVVAISIILLLLSSQLFASDENEKQYNDVVLLKNNGKIIGNIIEIIEGKKVIIEWENDGSIVEIPYKKIFKITDRDNLEIARGELFVEKSKEESVFPYSNITQLGMIDVDDDVKSFSTIVGTHLENNVFAGIGFSLYKYGRYDRYDRYDWYGGYNRYENDGLKHIFLDFHMFVSRDKYQPFAYLKIGGILDFGAGLAVSVHKNADIMIRTGYVSSAKNTNSMSLMVGIMFNPKPFFDTH